jgi:hypothetical protein
MKIKDFLKKLEIKKKTENKPDCGKLVHNSKPIKKPLKPEIIKTKSKKPKHDSLDYWQSRFDNQKTPWHEIKPFKLENDPLYGIPKELRSKIKNPNEKEIEKLPVLSDAETKEALKANSLIYQAYHEERRLELTKSEPELFKAQSEAILMYSDRLISLRKKVHVKHDVWKRGTKGHLIPERALDVLPEKYAEAFRKSMKETGSILCHIQGNLCTLDPEMVRYPKK